MPKKTEEKNYKYYAVQPQEFKKHNMLIGSKYKASLLENKLLTFCLSQIKCEKIDGQEVVYSELKASEIRKVLHAKGGSLYDRLEEIALGMSGRTIGMTDPKNHSFDYLAVVIRAKYEDGIFTVKYNPDLKDYIYNIKSNYTNYTIPIMMSFTNNYAFRLYEVLKSSMYKTRTIRYSLAELKFVTGAANAELESVRKILKGQKEPDYTKALNATPEQDYARWTDFKRKAIDPAIKEINEKSDIIVEYDVLTGGSGGKVVGVDFHVEYKDESKNNVEQQIETTQGAEISQSEKYALFDDLINYFSQANNGAPEFRFGLQDLDTICAAANYDKQKIITAYEIMICGKTKVENPVGFMLQAIKSEYQKPEPAKKKNQFNNFPESEFYNQMNLGELEEALLSSNDKE